MSLKIKAGTAFTIPVTIEDPDFGNIVAIEFIFKQKTKATETLKTAYWSENESECVDCQQTDDSKFLIYFSREDSYKFAQGKTFEMDTRIHYNEALTNPYTKITQLLMNETLFAEGEEVGPNGG